MTESIVVFIMAASDDEARRIATSLVDERLAACVNILPGCHSVFRWEGEVQEEDEVLLIVKTRAAVFPALERRVQELHSYHVPEIIALPIERGTQSYLAWLVNQVTL